MAETTAEQPLEELDIDSYTTESEVPVEGEYTSESLASRFGEPQPAAGLGRRKNAIARVRIVPGSGKWKINGRTLEDYFPNKVHQQEVNEPFKVLELEAVTTSSPASPAAVSPARPRPAPRCRPRLNEADVDNNRGPLKKAGFLRRDDRAVERKKAGLKKARKAPQYSKR